MPRVRTTLRAQAKPSPDGLLSDKDRVWAVTGAVNPKDFHKVVTEPAIECGSSLKPLLHLGLSMAPMLVVPCQAWPERRGCSSAPQVSNRPSSSSLYALAVGIRLRLPHSLTCLRFDFRLPILIVRCVLVGTRSNSTTFKKKRSCCWSATRMSSCPHTRRRARLSWPSKLTRRLLDRIPAV